MTGLEEIFFQILVPVTEIQIVLYVLGISMVAIPTQFRCWAQNSFDSIVEVGV